jgi:hypothetical protein
MDSGKIITIELFDSLTVKILVQESRYHMSLIKLELIHIGVDLTKKESSQQQRQHQITSQRIDTEKIQQQKGCGKQREVDNNSIDNEKLLAHSDGEDSLYSLIEQFKQLTIKKRLNSVRSERRVQFE